MAIETPHLPPEILQMIFRRLNLYNLLRCQRVCKTWRAHLPGNDPILRRRLFTNYPRVDDDEDSDNDSLYCVDEYGHPSDFDPTFIIPLKTSAEIARRPDSLPCLSYRLELDPRTDVSDWNVALPPRTTIHPILRHLEKNMHLINKSLFTDMSGKPTNGFDFETLEEFNMMIQELDDTSEQEDGSWKDMLLCVPPIPWAYIIFEHGPHLRRERTYKLFAENKGGVTLGQFANVFRQELRLMEECMDSFRLNVQLCCIYCGEEHPYCDCS